MSHTTQDWLLAHPRVDYSIPALTVLVAYLLVVPFGLSVKDATVVDISIAASAIAGLAMASSAFICTLTYQSTHPKIVAARQHHASEARKNWIAIIGATFAAALIPIVSLFFLEISSIIVVLASAFGLGLMTVRFSRSILWLSLTLFASDQPAEETEDGKHILRATV